MAKVRAVRCPHLTVGKGGRIGILPPPRAGLSLRATEGNKAISVTFRVYPWWILSGFYLVVEGGGTCFLPCSVAVVYNLSPGEIGRWQGSFEREDGLVEALPCWEGLQFYERNGIRDVSPSLSKFIGN